MGEGGPALEGGVGPAVGGTLLRDEFLQAGEEAYLLLLGDDGHGLVRKTEGYLVLLLQIGFLGLHHLVQLIVGEVSLDFLEAGIDMLAGDTLRIDRLVQHVFGLMLVPELGVRIAGNPVRLGYLIFARGEVPGTLHHDGNSYGFFACFIGLRRQIKLDWHNLVL